MWLLLLALAATPDAGPVESAPRLFAASLRERFAHCPGMTLREGAQLELSLPAPCRFQDGNTARGTLRFEFKPLPKADAPVRDRSQLFRVTAAPFAVGELEFDGVLLEGKVGEDGRGLRSLPRTTPLKTRRRASGPGPGWVSAPVVERDRQLDPIGDTAKDVVRGIAATPAIASAIATMFAQTLKEGILTSTPELVALWALSASSEQRDGG